MKDVNRGNPPIIVTGASSGVGRSLVHHLSSDFHVIGLARRIDRMQDEYGHIDSVTPYELDLTDVDQIRECVRAIREKHGPVRHLVNVAGLWITGGITEISAEDLLLSVRVDAVAPFVLMQELVPDMLEAGFGRIVNITSGATMHAYPETAAHTGAKAALNGITMVAAEEWRDRGVKVNLVEPGPVRTDMSPENVFDPSVCHPTVDYLLGDGESVPTGKLFWLGHEVPLLPELGAVDWLLGTTSDKLQPVVDIDLDRYRLRDDSPYLGSGELDWGT